MNQIVHVFHGHVLQGPRFQDGLLAKGLALAFQQLGVGVVLLNQQVVLDGLFPSFVMLWRGGSCFSTFLVKGCRCNPMRFLSGTFSLVPPTLTG